MTTKATVSDEAVEAAWLAFDNACPGEHWKVRERIRAALEAAQPFVRQEDVRQLREAFSPFVAAPVGELIKSISKKLGELTPITVTVTKGQFIAAAIILASPPADARLSNLEKNNG